MCVLLLVHICVGWHGCVYVCACWYECTHMCLCMWRPGNHFSWLSWVSSILLLKQSLTGLKIHQAGQTGRQGSPRNQPVSTSSALGSPTWVKTPVCSFVYLFVCFHLGSRDSSGSHACKANSILTESSPSLNILVLNCLNTEGEAQRSKTLTCQALICWLLRQLVLANLLRTSWPGSTGYSSKKSKIV